MAKFTPWREGMTRISELRPTRADMAAIDALIRLLPPPDSVWPAMERVAWLQSMEALLRYIYDPEGPQIDVEGLLATDPGRSLPDRG